MKDPVKGSGGWTEFERELLDAAVRDQIPPELKAKMAAALEGSLAGGAAAASTAPPAAAGAGGGLLFSKTIAIGIASALLVGGAVGWQLQRGADRTASAAAAARAAPVPAQANAADSTAATPMEPSASAPAPTAGGAALREEIALLDACRRAVKQDTPARALELLERYERRFPRGELAPEATALRIEALAQSGANERARALAQRFLAAYPASPLAQRVERIAAEPNQ